ncbi:thaumatin [Pterulicium gracile]|uniref:Thaumatin n=1 Tax=Pterulicium gracile TaxID=1884261 RepID=A0A5C3Q7T9_9AGAR|nr:thaumatin [Pterula gracilis]
MQFPTIFTVLLVALASSLEVFAAHEIRFKNLCSRTITPKWKGNGATSPSVGPALKTGGTHTASVAEKWVAGRAWGHDGSCSANDGAKCTLFECTFSNVGFNQCNISRVSGYNVPMAFSWVGSPSGCQGGKKCSSSTCPNTQAWLPPDSCNGCLSQCNKASVGMWVTFCPT